MPLQIESIYGGLDRCDLSIDEIIVEGPPEHIRVKFNEEKHLRVKYTVANRTEKPWAFLRVKGYLVSPTGALIEEEHGKQDHIIAPGDKATFTIHTHFGFPKSHLGEELSKATFILHVFGCSVVEAQLDEVNLPSKEPLVPAILKPKELTDSLRLVGGALWVREPDEDGYCGWSVKLLVQNKTVAIIPGIVVEATAYNKKDKEIFGTRESFDEVDPFNIRVLEATGEVHRRKLASLNKIKCQVACAEMASVGVAVSNSFAFAESLDSTGDLIELSSADNQEPESVTGGNDLMNTEQSEESADEVSTGVTLEATITWGYSNVDVKVRVLPSEFEEAKLLCATKKHSDALVAGVLIAGYLKCTFHGARFGGSLSDLFDQEMDEIVADRLTVYGVDFADSNLPKVSVLARFKGIKTKGILNKQLFEEWQEKNGRLDQCISFEWYDMDGLEEDLDLRSWSNSGLSLTLLEKNQ